MPRQGGLAIVCSRFQLTWVGRGVAEDAGLDTNDVSHRRDAVVCLVGEQVYIVVLVPDHDVVLERSVLDRHFDDVAAGRVRRDGDGAGSETRLDMSVTWLAPLLSHDCHVSTATHVFLPPQPLNSCPLYFSEVISPVDLLTLTIRSAPESIT